MSEQQDYAESVDASFETEEESDLRAAPEIPLGIILARILVVSAMSFSAAVAIFCAVGAIWLVAGVGVLLTIFFMLLMFGVERLAERRA